ncbi:MAG: sporulation integral membrane protein YtvI [Clostridia bacterium]|nr:sporulation integral membrane protein YtvI [Clostridia bacterium]
MEDQDARYRRHQRQLFYCIVGILLTAAAILLLRILFPFALAWLLALLLQPAIAKLSAFTGLSSKATGILLLTLTLLAGGGLLIFLCARLVTELPELADSLSQAAEGLSAKAGEITDRLHEKIPLLGALPEEDRNAFFGNLLREGLSTLSSKVTAWAGEVLMSLPGGLFVTVIFLMAAYYLITDFERVSRYLSSLLPRRAVQKLGGLRYRLFSTTVSYLRAYLILLAITFGELLLAFLFLRVRYAITLAFLIALLDALPAIGVGTVLIPWGVIELISGDPGRGIALLVIWLAVTLLRQFLEPRIVGAKLGLHPLAALAAVWAGFRLMGVWGLFIAPVAAILLRGALDGRRQWVKEHDR